MAMLPEWAVEQASKECDALETRMLLAPLLEVVPDALLLEPLTEDLYRYFSFLLLASKRSGYTMNNEMLTKVAAHHNRILTSPHNPAVDGEIVYKMLTHRLPPCVVCTEHVDAFVDYLSRKKDVLLERRFRDKAVDLMLNVAFPGTKPRAV